MNQVYLPPIIVNFLQQQAISQPQYHKPVPIKSHFSWPKLYWLIWGAIAIVVFQLTIIISFGNSFNNWYVVGLSLLMIGLGAMGGWWWLKSVVRARENKGLTDSSFVIKNYQYSYRQYSQAQKLLERQQHRKLRQLLSGQIPNLFTQLTLTPEEKQLKTLLKKTFPFLQVKNRVKCLIKKEWVEIEWVIISERTQVFLGVFFENENKDYYLRLLEDTSLRDRLLEENWGIIEVTSTQSLMRILAHLIERFQLL